MNFSFYMVDSKYCDYLRKSEPLVPYTMEQKGTRPFIGIVLTIHDFNYYAPLTSPKPKHLKMKNQIDFMKINQGVWGAINFNNMIPVKMEYLHKIELNIHDTDTPQDIAYKNLLSNQLSWCNSHKDQIIKQAQKIYAAVTKGKAWGNLTGRCCNFSLIEQQCLSYDPNKDILTES